MNSLKYYPAFSEIILCVAALIALLVGVLQPANIQTRFHKLTVKSTAAAICGILLITTYFLLKSPSQSFVFWQSMASYNIMSVYGKVLIYGLGGLLLIPIGQFLYTAKLKQFELIILILFTMVGGGLAICANHMLTFFLGIEICNLPQYILAASKRDSSHSSEAAIKFFMTGAVATCLMLMGMSLIYGFTGTNFFNNLYYFFNSPVYDISYGGAVIGVFLVLISLLIKLGTAPFHGWVVDLYQGVAPSVLTYLATLPKLITLLALLHLTSNPFYGLFSYWRYLFAIVAIVSMIWGSIAALKQTNILRLFGYSSVGNMGVLLLGPTMGGEIGLKAAVMYLVIYVITMIGVLFILSWYHNTFKGGYAITDYRSLSKTNPVLAATFCVLVLSLAGIPPFPGFFAKFYILEAILNRSAYLMAILMVLVSVVSASYYLQLVKVIILESQSNIISDGTAKINYLGMMSKYQYPPLLLRTSLALLLVLLGLLIIYPDLLLNLVSAISVSAIYQS